MKSVLIALERSSFTYLYKFGYTQVSKGQLLEYSAFEARMLAQENDLEFVNKLESRLPHFEQEQEVVILEISQLLDPSQTIFELDFEQIQQIIPLNPLARELVEAKTSDHITISESFPERFYQQLLEVRQHKIRSRCANSLVSVFKLQLPKTEFRKQVQKATLVQLKGQVPNIEASTMTHVIDFNTTPSFIPEGLIEGMIKLICVGAKKLGADVNSVPKGIVYKTIKEGVEQLNSANSFVSAFDLMEDIFRSKEPDTQDKFEKLKATLKFNETELNSLMVIYLYYSYRRFLQKNDFDLEQLKGMIEADEWSDETAAAIYMIGYTLSMPLLFESLHQIRKAPVFVSKPKKRLNEELTTYKSDAHLSGKFEEPKTDYVKKPANSESEGKEKKATGNKQSNLFENDVSQEHPNQKIIKRVNVMVRGTNSKIVKAIVKEMLSGHSTPNIEEFENRFRATENLVRKNGELLKPVLNALEILQDELRNNTH